MIFERVFFMLVTLKKGNFEISADSFGAELHSVKLDGREYLWQCGDAWKRYAPILFPFICSPKDKKYLAGGREYTMPANHGFARDSRFELLSADESSVSFVLKASDETLKVYPYDFEFTVTYSIEEGKVTVGNRVVNKGKEDMYFYVGGHPAFNCPLDKGLEFEDYYVEYSNAETIVQPVPNGERTVVDGSSKLPLTRALFDFDVIMKDNPASNSVTLKSDKSDSFVRVDFSDSRCIAVWSPTGDDNAKFVCLEPWTSVPIYADDDYPDIENKPHAIKLGAGKAFDYCYSITVG